MEEIIEIIENTPLRDFIPKKYLNRLKILNLSSGEYFHYSEKELNAIFFLIGGTIQIKQTTQDGVDINYSLLHGFNVIGEKKILLGEAGEVDFCTIRDETKILEIPLDIGMELLKDDKFKIFLLKLHCEKLHKFVWDISILHFKGVEKFLAHNILTYSQEDKFRFKNMSFLSEILSIDRKSLYNSIKKLEGKKLILRENKTIKILDRKKLEEYSKI
jgi:CRP-like cAMP-binding protein